MCLNKSERVAAREKCATLSTKDGNVSEILIVW